MRWIAKAGLQRTLGVLPQGEQLNYIFQRHLFRSFPVPDKAVRQKFTRALAHVAAYEEFGPGTPRENATFYEFGAGWDLAIPVAYALLGVGKQVLVDIRPSARLELVNHSIAALERLRPQLEEEAGRSLGETRGPVASLAELEPRFGIRYLAPCDARDTGLPPGSIDFASSTDTCEHIPGDDLAAIFRESRRILKPGGAFSCRIDLQDHYSYFDPRLSRYHFLRFSDRRWAVVNSPLHFQNRLRSPEYLKLVRDAGFELVRETPSGPNDKGRAELAELPLAERFRGMPIDDLGVTILSFVARA